MLSWIHLLSKLSATMRGEILTVLLACSLPKNIASRRSFGFHFKSVQCIGNATFLDLYECSVREKNTISTISMDLHLVEDIGKVTYDLLVVLPQARHDIVLFDISDMDGCDFLENTSQFTLVKIIRKLFSNYSNMPNKCPVRKGTSIRVHDLKLDPESFPSYVPETKFYVRVRLYEMGASYLNLTINGTCENTRKFYRG